MSSRSYRIFLGAPPYADLKERRVDPNIELSSRYEWRTFTTPSTTTGLRQPPDAFASTQQADWIVPPATLQAASQLISKLYENVIFRDDTNFVDEGGSVLALGDIEGRSEEFYSWEESEEIRPSMSKLAGERTALSFMTSLAGSISRVDSIGSEETQDTPGVSYSDASSIAAFPAFRIELRSVVPLLQLSDENASDIPQNSKAGHVPPQPGKPRSVRVGLLVCVLSVDGPDAVKLKQGADAGQEVGILKLIVGDESGRVAKLTAWREVAEEWGYGTESVTKGDVIFLENISAVLPHVSATGESVPLALTASPFSASKVHICYRTLPLIPTDRRFRPDLRLANSDVGVRRVAGLVRWFEGVIGIG